MAKKSIKAGELKRRLQIQSQVITRDTSLGFNNDNWNLIDIVWGKVEPISGREFFAKKQVDSDVTHMVTIRYYPAIPALDATFRFVNEAQILNIKSLLNIDMENNVVEVLCTERTGTKKEIPLYHPDGSLVKHPSGQTWFTTPVTL